MSVNIVSQFQSSILAKTSANAPCSAVSVIAELLVLTHCCTCVCIKVSRVNWFAGMCGVACIQRYHRSRRQSVQVVAAQVQHSLIHSFQKSC